MQLHSIVLDAPPTSTQLPWEDLPLDLRRTIMHGLTPHEAVLVAETCRDIYELVQDHPFWPKLARQASTAAAGGRAPYQGAIDALNCAIVGPQTREVVTHALAMASPSFVAACRKDGLDYALFSACLRAWEWDRPSSRHEGVWRGPVAAEMHFAYQDLVNPQRSSSALTLDLSGFPLRELPECVGQLTDLEYLNLRNCEYLRSMPESIGRLTSLKSINMRDCEDLGALPAGIRHLTSLIDLCLHGCDSLVSLPEEIGELHNLQHLDVAYCYHLAALPESVGNLTSLETLNLRHCPKLVTLPQSLSLLPALDRLILTGCSSLDLSDLPDM